MGSIISKWVFPGIATVIIGTFAALFFSQSSIEEDLTQKSLAIIANGGGQYGADWAQISFDARDGRISGTTTDGRAASQIVEQISAIPGVRSLSSNIELAPAISPYPFVAVLNEGIVSLSGGVPSIAVRDALLEITGAKDAGLDLISGVPEGDWTNAALFAVSRLGGLESGQAILSDLSLSITGLAKSFEEYLALTTSLMGKLPAGVTLKTAAISPPFVENYIFDAIRKNGDTIVSGLVPNEATRTKIAELTGASIENLQLASGAPQNFMSSLDFGLKLLGTTIDGKVRLKQSELSFSGIAATRDDFEMATSLLTSGIPQGVELKVFNIDPAIKDPYFWFVQKSADGSISIFGNLPNEATRAAIMRRAGENAIDRTKISSGAPETFYADALSAISALSNLDEGRAGYAGGTWYLLGEPNSQQAADMALSALLGARTKAENWRLTITEAPPVPVIPYLWSADKFSNGTIILNGNVPDQETKDAILLASGENVRDNMSISFGAPQGFAQDSLVAISALQNLETGRAGLFTTGWFLFGQALDNAALQAATNALADSSVATDLWRIELPKPPKPPEPEIVVIEEAPIEETAPVAKEAPNSVLLTASATCQSKISKLLDTNNIKFNTASARIKSDSLSVVREISTYLKQCPDSRIYIEGYSYNQGDFANNLKLSSDRADSIVYALVKLGIDRDRMLPISYGQDNPVTSNESTGGRQLNRRIIFKIID